MKTHNINIEAINEMERMAQLINNIENTTSDEVDTTIGGMNQSSGNTRYSDIEGMTNAINALRKAEMVNESYIQNSDNDSSSDLDSLDAEMSYTNSDICVEGIEDYFTLRVGDTTLVKKSYSENGLNKLKSLIENGNGIEHPDTIKLLRNIGIQVAAKNTINESKQKYNSYKKTSNIAGMNEQKRIYNDAKKQLSSTEQLLK